MSNPFKYHPLLRPLEFFPFHTELSLVMTAYLSPPNSSPAKWAHEQLLQFLWGACSDHFSDDCFSSKNPPPEFNFYSLLYWINQLLLFYNNLFLQLHGPLALFSEYQIFPDCWFAHIHKQIHYATKIQFLKIPVIGDWWGRNFDGLHELFNLECRLFFSLVCGKSTKKSIWIAYYSVLNATLADNGHS